MPITQVPRLISELYRIVAELNRLFKPRPFTPDGHLVGSIGEVVAAYTYGVKLASCSNPGFDGKLQDGRTVEIKLTGRNSINISKTDKYADCLIALKLDPNSGFIEVYAGEFPEELIKSKTINKRGFTAVTVKTLQSRNPATINQGNRLSELNALFPKATL